jgi:peptidoglycan/xylan/chitin deacetylase (PgdA/CDA1 family)
MRRNTIFDYYRTCLGLAATLLLAILVIGCTPGEPVADPLEVVAALPELTQPVPPLVESPSQLPTTGPSSTTVAPPSPTPPPTTTSDPAIVAGQEALIATRTAAASPPTPEVTGLPATEPAVSPPAELMPTPMGVYSWTLKVPILMYHYISKPPEDADEYRTDLSVTPDQFREQLSYLKDNGYTTIDLYDLSQAIVSQIELPEKPIILTFDDGYLDNYENAFPVLQEFGYEGTFFVVTEFIDKQREGYMTWAMVEEMARSGMRMESHSRTHPDLRGISRERLIWEILGSQETLAAHIGYIPRYFCHPGGWYDEATIQMLQELNFWGATTTQNGSWHGFDDRFEWRRVRIRNTTSLDEFARLVDLEGTISGKTPP